MQSSSLWKRVLILLICSWGFLAAVPNLFYARVEPHNDAIAAIDLAGGTATPEQAAARAEWPDFLPSALMNLGLDLRGGAHLLAEVQVEDVYKSRIDALWPEVRDVLRDLRDQVGAVKSLPSPDGVLRVSITNPDGMAAALEAVSGLGSSVVSLTGIGGAADHMVEGQLGGLADQFLQFTGRADARHLDQDPVHALPLDRRFAGSSLINPAADDFQRLLQGALVRGQLFGV